MLIAMSVSFAILDGETYGGEPGSGMARGSAAATVTGPLKFTFRLNDVAADKIAAIVEAAALAELQRVVKPN
jgi:hypothetical protein